MIIKITETEGSSSNAYAEISGHRLIFFDVTDQEGLNLFNKQIFDENPKIQGISDEERSQLMAASQFLKVQGDYVLCCKSMNSGITTVLQTIKDKKTLEKCVKAFEESMINGDTFFDFSRFAK